MMHNYLYTSVYDSKNTHFDSFIMEFAHIELFIFYNKWPIINSILSILRCTCVSSSASNL